ncbi:hypothetical protein J2S13_002526 [Oikeobacillus pervagus]|uniref:Uncharacterized protein n=1 Tax=Oikeobacillus pervagus TaxID=1325931 RepID=A0AAJ1T0P8_9BACI|nr:hypothetical protein [Oikeobacillus pervagus]MDQ0216104.1 hypothetical protein [Oikeobacillus pervagus]
MKKWIGVLLGCSVFALIILFINQFLFFLLFRETPEWLTLRSWISFVIVFLFSLLTFIARNQERNH